MYTEATSNFNNTSNLIGPCFDLTSATSAQFSFYFHMYGADMGTLNVELSTNSGLSYPSKFMVAIRSGTKQVMELPGI